MQVTDEKQAFLNISNRWERLSSVVSHPLTDRESLSFQLLENII
jgi:hypothetical protein